MEKICGFHNNINKLGICQHVSWKWNYSSSLCLQSNNSLIQPSCSRRLLSLYCNHSSIYTVLSWIRWVGCGLEYYNYIVNTSNSVNDFPLKLLKRTIMSHIYTDWWFWHCFNTIWFFTILMWKISIYLLWHLNFYWIIIFALWMQYEYTPL